jgi:arginyl-tRNA synthetase
MEDLKADGVVPAEVQVQPDVEHPTSPEHGDYATNAAMKLAKPCRQSPKAIAEKLKIKLEARGQGILARVEVAGPGFVNLYLHPSALMQELQSVRVRSEAYGTDAWGAGRRLLLEFVSANPVGPLNIVSARAAAVGDTLARVLRSQGVHVEKEYYVNDAGNQAKLFGRSLYARWRQSLGEDVPVPEEGYQGEYVAACAAECAQARAAELKNASVEQAAEIFRSEGVARMVASHRHDLAEFGVEFDHWFSELTLHESGQVQAALDDLKTRGYIFEHEGAIWFKSTEFGDDKDRVLIKADGVPAYIAADVAYHRNKFNRGFTELVDIWGPDHHGYIARMKASMQALGHEADAFRVLIAQQVNLMENGQPVAMSKRAGIFITMADLIKDVGRDVARFFFLMRSTDAHLDFDLDLARKHTDENPVFYVQYAHARICSILRKAAGEGWVLCEANATPELTQPWAPEELAVIRSLTSLPEILEAAARNLEPHGLAFYLRDLATEFHRFYTVCRVLDSEDKKRSEARLALIDAIRIVLRNGLDLLGIGAPDSM